MPKSTPWISNPYSYQQEILDKLEAERQGSWAIPAIWWLLPLVQAKRSISALDYKCFRKQNPDKPCRLLFVAHREEILKAEVCIPSVLYSRTPTSGRCLWAAIGRKGIDNLFISIQTFNSQDFTAQNNTGVL